MMDAMTNDSPAYRALCTEFYDLDKPVAPEEDLKRYLKVAAETGGPILEPMCGSGRFLLPLLERGYTVTGFDPSPHMLSVCRKKCLEKGYAPELLETTFALAPLTGAFQMILIPAGSLGLLTDPHQLDHALHIVRKHLGTGGRFAFDIETPEAVSESQGTWTGRWLTRADGSKLLINSVTRYDPSTRVETSLCRYELWQGNAITKVEVEEFRLHIFASGEMDGLLERHGFRIICRHPQPGTLNYECEGC